MAAVAPLVISDLSAPTDQSIIKSNAAKTGRGAPTVIIGCCVCVSCCCSILLIAVIAIVASQVVPSGA